MDDFMENSGNLHATFNHLLTHIAASDVAKVRDTPRTHTE